MYSLLVTLGTVSVGRVGEAIHVCACTYVQGLEHGALSLREKNNSISHK